MNETIYINWIPTLTKITEFEVKRISVFPNKRFEKINGSYDKYKNHSIVKEVKNQIAGEIHSGKLKEDHS